jgi:hypothetical protein
VKDTQPPSRQGRSLTDYGRQIQHDAQTLIATVQDATTGFESYLTTQVTRRPYGTVGLAAGVGYALGGGLSSWLTVAMFGAATRLATALAARELGARFAPNGPVGATKERG